MEPRKLSIKDFYDKVWGEYADPQYHPITAEALSTQARIVAQRIQRDRPGKVLDLGCGPSPVIPVDAAPLVVCADLVFRMLLHIKENRSGPVLCLDAQRLPFSDDCFHFIWCGLLIDHIRDPKGWIEELLRVLKPGAVLGMACWHRSTLPTERYPDDNRMCYTTSQGEELSVRSFPTWQEALRILRGHDPSMQLDAHTIVPDEYVLQVAWVRVPP
jgi:SAM-dependent methyltransferase